MTPRDWLVEFAVGALAGVGLWVLVFGTWQALT